MRGKVRAKRCVQAKPRWAQRHSKYENNPTAGAQTLGEDLPEVVG